MIRTKPSLGGDPEFFIFIKDEDGKYNIISADKAGLPGKLEPIRFNAQGDSAFFDGVQAEINFRHHTCREVITGNIKNCILGTLEEVRKHLKMDTPIHFAPLASVQITKDVIKVTDKECRRFGCSPDANIYSSDSIKYPDGSKFMTRFSGGHIHLGFSEIKYQAAMKEADNLLNLVRTLDLIPGILSVCLSQGNEELIRRKWYGKAGTYRMQAHGIEYRTLSSFWIASPQLVSIMYAAARDAFTLTVHEIASSVLETISETELQKTIDKCDVKNATRIWESIVLPLYSKHQIDSPLADPDVTRYIKSLISKGGYTSEFNPMNMLHNWGLRCPNIYYEIGWDRTHGIQGFLNNYHPALLKTIREVE